MQATQGSVDDVTSDWLMGAGLRVEGEVSPHNMFAETPRDRGCVIARESAVVEHGGRDSATPSACTDVALV